MKFDQDTVASESPHNVTLMVGEEQNEGNKQIDKNEELQNKLKKVMLLWRPKPCGPAG